MKCNINHKTSKDLEEVKPMTKVEIEGKKKRAASLLLFPMLVNSLNPYSREFRKKDGIKTNIT